jgi:hypothetical protein
MTDQAFAILRKFYPSEGLYLKELSNFSVSTSSILGTFNVTHEAAYSVVPLNYVTAEQHVRCFSQLSYGLMYLLSIYHDGMTLYMGAENFERAMMSGQMWYRKLNSRYLRMIQKGEDFQLQLEMASIRRVGKYAIARLTATGSVIVEAEFVTPV